MADDKKESGGVMEDVAFVVGGLIILVVIWFLLGGPGRADLKGLFLAPPAPLGTGESYGPQFGEPASSTNQ